MVRRVYLHEVAMVEYVRYLEAGGLMDYEEWYFLRQEHREMLLDLAEGGWSGALEEVPDRMSELERSLGYGEE